MARPVYVSSALVLALLFSDCSKKSEGNFEQEPTVAIDLGQIRERGFLQAIVDNNSISYFIYRGQPMGYEYELLQSLTRHLKVKLKIKVISGIEQSIDLLNKGEGRPHRFPTYHYPGAHKIPFVYGYTIQYLSGARSKETCQLA